jgi:hypothetical protein
MSASAEEGGRAGEGQAAQAGGGHRGGTPAFTVPRVGDRTDKAGGNFYCYCRGAQRAWEWWSDGSM